MSKTSRILRSAAILAASSGVLLVLGWAFAAYLHPDRVGDFASFLQLCGAVLGR